MKTNADVFLGLFFVVLGLVVWLVLVPVGVEKSAYGGFAEAGLVGPKLLPTVTSIGIALMGAMLVMRSFLVKGRAGKRTKAFGVTPPEKEEPLEEKLQESDRNQAIVQFLFVSFGYVLVLYLLGYVVATILLLISLQLLFGERRRLVLILLPTLFSVGIYVFFRYALLVQFPQGRLFSLLG